MTYTEYYTLLHYELVEDLKDLLRQHKEHNPFTNSIYKSDTQILEDLKDDINVLMIPCNKVNSLILTGRVNAFDEVDFNMFDFSKIDSQIN